MSSKVLVVDDNRSNLDLMLYLLRAFGYEAEGASDGLAGLQKAQEGAYDLLLVDILMPGIDGYEFARRMREGGQATPPMVAVTALAMVGDRERILGAGFDGYLAKPINPQTFVPQLEAYLPAPLRAEAPVDAPSAQPVDAGKERTGPIVMVVDDVDENVAVIHAALEPFGYRVLEARSADEALELLKHATPQLLICDLHMPRQNGLDLARQLRQETAFARLPIVFISSTQWSAADQERGRQFGVRTFLERPIEPERLRRAVEAALAP